MPYYKPETNTGAALLIAALIGKKFLGKKKKRKERKRTERREAAGRQVTEAAAGRAPRALQPPEQTRPDVLEGVVYDEGPLEAILRKKGMDVPQYGTPAFDAWLGESGRAAQIAGAGIPVDPMFVGEQGQLREPIGFGQRLEAMKGGPGAAALPAQARFEAEAGATVPLPQGGQASIGGRLARGLDDVRLQAAQQALDEKRGRYAAWEEEKQREQLIRRLAAVQVGQPLDLGAAQEGVAAGMDPDFAWWSTQPPGMRPAAATYRQQMTEQREEYEEREQRQAVAGIIADMDQTGGIFTPALASRMAATTDLETYQITDLGRFFNQQAQQSALETEKELQRKYQGDYFDMRSLGATRVLNPRQREMMFMAGVKGGVPLQYVEADVHEMMLTPEQRLQQVEIAGGLRARPAEMERLQQAHERIEDARKQFHALIIKGQYDDAMELMQTVARDVSLGLQTPEAYNFAQQMWQAMVENLEPLLARRIPGRESPGVAPPTTDARTRTGGKEDRGGKPLATLRGLKFPEMTASMAERAQGRSHWLDTASGEVVRLIGPTRRRTGEVTVEYQDGSTADVMMTQLEPTEQRWKRETAAGAARTGTYSPGVGGALNVLGAGQRARRK